MTLQERLYQYYLLTRLHKPVGILLLLWPTLWALWIAAAGVPDLHILIVFTLGVVLMRSAGCVINDFADRHFDPHVARTRERPIAAGRVSPREALILFAGLCLLAFALVLTLNRQTLGLDMLLRHRGFIIYKREPADDLLIPQKKFQQKFYGMLHKYSFRLFLRDVIKHQIFFRLENVTRYATSEVTSDYVDYMSGIGMLEKVPGGFRLAFGPIKSFGETLEWFVAQVFQREFATPSIWNVWAFVKALALYTEGSKFW